MANVQVILQEKIADLGVEADLVSVRRGYARNYLVPKGLALEATRANLRLRNALEKKRAQRESRELDDAQQIASRLRKLKLSLVLSTGQGGKAFGSITTQDIANAIAGATDGLEIDRHKIELEKPIKQHGKFTIPIHVHPEVSANLKLEVTSPNAEAAAEEG
jgi:large subunit ribosomal protein L9